MRDGNAGGVRRLVCSAYAMYLFWRENSTQKAGVTTMSRSYAIIGAGAVGGFYGARLAHSGHDVHFLFRNDCKQAQEQGLSIESPSGDFSLSPVNAYDNPRDMPRCDVAIVAVKATQNHALGDILPHVLTEDGVVALFQNGLLQEKIIAGIPGVRRVISVLCFICSSKVGPARIRHYEYGRVQLAEFGKNGNPAGITSAVQALADDLRRAGIDVSVSDDWLLARWKKLVWNIPFNGLTVALDTDTQSIMNDGSAKALAVTLMHETVAGAAAFSRTIEDNFVQRMIAYTCEMKPYLPSMKLDFDAGRPMELDAMYRAPVAAAAAKGVGMPVTRALLQQLTFLENRKRTSAEAAAKPARES